MKHHFDECVERVTAAQENPDAHKGAKEDCVEECMILRPDFYCTSPNDMQSSIYSIAQHSVLRPSSSSY